VAAERLTVAGARAYDLAMRLLACALLAALAGCGGSASGNPSAIEGNYTVQISANNKTDDDEMTINPASNNGVLLDFVYGISPVRCAVMGSNQITIPNQMLQVDHSTGRAQGVGSGGGTIDGGMVDITIDLESPGFGPTDGGQGGGGKVSYHITGMKM
jgi:hypothetical protein